MEKTIKRLFSFEKSVDKKEYWETILILLMGTVVLIGMFFSIDEFKDISLVYNIMGYSFLGLFMTTYIILPLALLKGRAKNLGRSEFSTFLMLLFAFLFFFDYPGVFLFLFISLMCGYGLLDRKA